jgi:hypothetical protein
MAEEATVTLELTLDLPQSLVAEAEANGLLSPESLEALLREEVRRRRVAKLFDAADRLAALDDAPLTDEEVQAEIDAARAEKRARGAGHR